MAPKLKKGTKLTTSGITRVEVLPRHTPSPEIFSGTLKCILESLEACS